MAEINGIQITTRLIRQVYSLMWENLGWGIKKVHNAVQPSLNDDWVTSAHLDDARRIVYYLRASNDNIPGHMAEMYRMALSNNFSKINQLDINIKNKGKITWIDVDNLRNMYHKYKCE